MAGGKFENLGSSLRQNAGLKTAFRPVVQHYDGKAAYPSQGRPLPDIRELNSRCGAASPKLTLIDHVAFW